MEGAYRASEPIAESGGPRPQQVGDLLGGEPGEVVVVVGVVRGVDVGGGDVPEREIGGDVDERGVLAGHGHHARDVGGDDVAARASPLPRRPAEVAAAAISAAYSHASSSPSAHSTRSASVTAWARNGPASRPSATSVAARRT